MVLQPIKIIICKLIYCYGTSETVIYANKNLDDEPAIPNHLLCHVFRLYSLEFLNRYNYIII